MITNVIFLNFPYDCFENEFEYFNDKRVNTWNVYLCSIPQDPFLYEFYNIAINYAIYEKCTTKACHSRHFKENIESGSNQLSFICLEMVKQMIA